MGAIAMLCALLVTPAQVSDLLSEVSPAQVEGYVNHLAGAEAAPLAAGDQVITSRSVHHPDITLAEDYLVETLEGWGLTVRRLPFPYNGASLANVEATLLGSELPDEIVLLGAHYDSTACDDPGWMRSTDPAPGADDNASSCAAVLEAARVLSRARLQRTVRFVFFSAEEVGLVGSQHYATETIAGDDLRTFLNLDPLGNTGMLEDNFFIIYDDASENDSLRMEALQDTYDLDYPIIRVPGGTGAFADNRSDHQSLRDAGFVGLHGGTLSDTINHTMDDTVAVVDFEFVTDATRASLAYIAESAGYLDHDPPPSVGDGDTDELPPPPAAGDLPGGCASLSSFPGALPLSLFLIGRWARRRCRREERDSAPPGAEM